MDDYLLRETYEKMLIESFGGPMHVNMDPQDLYNRNRPAKCIVDSPLEKEEYLKFTEGCKAAARELGINMKQSLLEKFGPKCIDAMNDDVLEKMSLVLHQLKRRKISA